MIWQHRLPITRRPVAGEKQSLAISDGIGKNVDDVSYLHNPAVVDNGDPLHISSMTLIVGDDYDGKSKFLVNLFQQPEDRMGCCDLKHGSFITEQYLGLVQSPGNGHACFCPPKAEQGKLRLVGKSTTPEAHMRVSVPRFYPSRQFQREADVIYRVAKASAS